MAPFKMRMSVSAVIAMVAVALAPIARAGSADAIADARGTVAVYKRADPGIARFLEQSAGYAVFPGVDKGAVGIGGAHCTGGLFGRGPPTWKVRWSPCSIARH